MKFSKKHIGEHNPILGLLVGAYSYLSVVLVLNNALDFSGCVLAV